MGLLFIAGGVSGQARFGWKSALDTIRHDGFYRILLTPEIVAKCSRADLGDLRIVGSDKRFVSYVLKDSIGGKERLAVPGASLVQKDSSDKHSYLDVRFPDAYELDQLSFLIQDPAFYKRDAEVTAQGLDTTEWMLLTTVTLKPGSRSFALPAVKTRRLRIDITNADNAPLVVREVSGAQAPRWLVTYLKAGAAYQVLTGDGHAAKPEYDLKYFTDSLTTMPPTLAAGPVLTAVAADQPSEQAPVAAAPKAVEPAHSGNLLLWGILLAILILLVFFSVRMVKSITQKEQNDRV